MISALQVFPPPVWSVTGFNAHPLGAVRIAFRAGEATLCRAAYVTIEHLSPPGRSWGRALVGADGSRLAAVCRLAQWGTWPPNTRRRLAFTPAERAQLRMFERARRRFERRCDRLGAVIASRHPRWWPRLVDACGSVPESLAVLDREWRKLPWGRHRNLQRTDIRWRSSMSGFQMLAWDGTTHVGSLIDQYLSARRHRLLPIDWSPRDEVNAR